MSVRRLTPDALMAKADMACSSARVLLDLGDVDGAANRACYAMFDAARAALLASAASVEPDIGRTHSGLIGAFGNFLVKNGPISNFERGGALAESGARNPVDGRLPRRLRRACRREGDGGQAENFVAVMRAEFMPEESDDNGDGLPP